MKILTTSAILATVMFCGGCVAEAASSPAEIALRREMFRLASRLQSTQTLLAQCDEHRRLLLALISAEAAAATEEELGSIHLSRSSSDLSSSSWPGFTDEHSASGASDGGLLRRATSRNS